MSQVGYHVATAAVWVLAFVLGLTLWVIINPTVRIPVLSSTVCGMKGGQWITTFIDRPGCYQPEEAP